MWCELSLYVCVFVLCVYDLCGVVCVLVSVFVCVCV